MNISLRSGSKTRILLLNPNSSDYMTQGMKAAALAVIKPQDDIELFSYTAPENAPASINDGDDINQSTVAVLADLSASRFLEKESFDAILIACFSVHTLVHKIPQHFPKLDSLVTGIFEASISSALSLLPALSGQETWGIVTTGKFWESHLAQGANEFLGVKEGSNAKFAGVFSTGLNAGDFHSVPEEEVRERLKTATGKLLKTAKVTCVVMGCGGMAGLEDIIRDTAKEIYGEEDAKKLYVVDGVKAGIMELSKTVASKQAFRSKDLNLN